MKAEMICRFALDKWNNIFNLVSMYSCNILQAMSIEIIIAIYSTVYVKVFIYFTVLAKSFMETLMKVSFRSIAIHSKNIKIRSTLVTFTPLTVISQLLS